MMRPLRKIKELRAKFLAGPDWLEIPDWIASRNYRSHTAITVAWIYALMTRFLTIPGRMMILVSMMIFSHSLISVTTPIRVLAFAIFAVLVIDVVFGFLFRPKLEIKRSAPARTAAGSVISLDYEIKNRRKLPAWGVEVDPMLARRMLRFTRKPASFDVMPPGQSLWARNTMKTCARGQLLLPPPLLEASFPFCIFQWSCRCGDAQKILVHPAYESLQSLALPMGQRYQRHGTALVSKVGESPDFLGCRDFRTGDDFRRIHWRSTARTGNLVVREFQEEYLCRIAMIVDTFVPKEPLWRRMMGAPRANIEFEAAISLTAAISEYLARGDYVVDIFAAGPDIYHFQGGRSLGYFENILDILACLEPNRGEPMRTLAPAVLDEISGIGSAVAVLLKWDEPRRELIQCMTDAGVSVKVLLVAPPKIPQELPEYVSVLSAEDIFLGRVRSL